MQCILHSSLHCKLFDAIQKLGGGRFCSMITELIKRVAQIPEQNWIPSLRLVVEGTLAQTQKTVLCSQQPAVQAAAIPVPSFMAHWVEAGARLENSHVTCHVAMAIAGTLMKLACRTLDRNTKLSTCVMRHLQGCSKTWQTCKTTSAACE